MMAIFLPGDERSFATNLGVWLSDARERMELSARDLAELLGVHENTLYRWESGETMPNAYQFETLRKYIRGTVTR